MCGGISFLIGNTLRVRGYRMASGFITMEKAMEIVAYFFGGLFVLLFILMALAAVSVDKHSSTDFPEGGYEDRT